jgi:hypothetical protein
LSDDKRQQVRALGRLGWSLRRIQTATGVRRETASGHPKGGGDLRRLYRQLYQPRARRLDAHTARAVRAADDWEIDVITRWKTNGAPK